MRKIVQSSLWQDTYTPAAIVTVARHAHTPSAIVIAARRMHT